MRANDNWYIVRAKVVDHIDDYRTERPLVIGALANVYNIGLFTADPLNFFNIFGVVGVISCTTIAVKKGNQFDRLVRVVGKESRAVVNGSKTRRPATDMCCL